MSDFFKPSRTGSPSKVYLPGSSGYEKNKVFVGVDFTLVGGTIIGGVKEGIKEGAEIVLEMAKEIAPSKSGELRESGRVVTKQTGEFVGGKTYNVEPKSTVVFGNTKIHYAALHENWAFADYISPTTPGTRPRFLKLAIRKAKELDVMRNAIARKISYANKHNRSAWRPQSRLVTKP